MDVCACDAEKKRAVELMSMRATDEVICSGDTESGQLWTEKATKATHIIVACACGVIHAKGVAGIWRGPQADFEALFERIPSESEKALTRPSSVKARRTGKVVVRPAANPKNQIRFENRENS